MDILGPFPTAPGNKRYILMVTDYFTKWAEAEAMGSITAKAVKKFLWKNVFCRFGVPRVIITDNGPQFNCHKIKEFCREHSVDLRFAAVAHPRANGQAEATNKTVLALLKKKLNRAKGQWADALPAVLWAYRTTAKEGTGATPFSLAFGCEAVIPAEVRFGSPRVRHFHPEQNSEGLATNVELIEEIRDQAAERHAVYRARIARYHNLQVHERALRPGDWALRRADVTNRGNHDGKLAETWEGPYRVTSVIRPGTYQLERADDTTLPHAWNIINLRKFYI